MNSELKYWYLHDHRLFRKLSFSEIDTLCILKRFKKSKKNEIIDLPFSEKERVYFLKHGIIKLVKINDDGEEVLLEILQKGDIFGDLNLQKNEGNEEYFKVVSDEAIICTFFRENLELVMQKKPEFALSYIRFSGLSINKIQNSYKNILFKDAKTRLILLFSSIIEKENQTEGAYVISNFLTQKDIAQLICTTRQTVITLLKELEKSGILQYSQKEILISDVKEFQNFTLNVK
jgi:CRP/FNR family transcriptional regulator, cyclic AMP receptor protein